MQENTIQDIAAATATTASQGFLNTIPAHLKEALSARFLSNLEGELQAELQALIQSRLLWSQQAIQVEQAEQQRLKELQAKPEPPQAEATPERLVPASRPQAKRLSLKSDHPLQARAISSTVPVALIREEEALVEDPETTAAHQDAQVERLGMSEPESLKPRRRRRRSPGTPPLVDEYQPLSSDPEAKPRRRRRSAASLA